MVILARKCDPAWRPLASVGAWDGKSRGPGKVRRPSWRRWNWSWIPEQGVICGLLPGNLSGQPAPCPSHRGPELIQEVNVQSPGAITLPDFSFSFLEHRALSFHGHPTHARPCLPCYSPVPAISPVILCPLPPLCPAGLPECSHGSTCHFWEGHAEGEAACGELRACDLL